jgi:transcriptional regulator with XRE-family HTH domain
MDSLGQRLRCFRLEKGWSKRSLAVKLGVSIPSIIRWETEVAVPNDYNRYKIERFLSRKASLETKSIPVYHSAIEQLSLFYDKGETRKA